ncbi:MAG: insulinase family protein [Candidatus Omnitrophica bacterium]|nr:insulinase family protein [Candidatus Omnitrophota bacterium]
MNKKLKIALLFFLFFAVYIDAYCQNSAKEKFVLDNGLTVILEPMPSSPTTSVYALVKTGSSTEDKYLGSGITHFLEHMLFKETKNRKVGELAANIQSAGGTINAFTGKDVTVYTIRVPNESLNTALDVVSDMLINFKISEEEFEKERKVIISEVRKHKDDPDDFISELVFENSYLSHSYRVPVIGYEENLSRLTVNDLLDYYNSRYVANNVILSIAGKIDTATALSKVKDYFKDFERKRDLNVPRQAEPQQISPRSLTLAYPTNLARLTIAFQGVNLLNEDIFALDALSEILGGGRSSRLYREIYQRKGLVYSISAGNYTPEDRGLFFISAVLEEDNIAQVRGEIYLAIEGLIKSPVKKYELDKIKKGMAAELIMSRQRSSDLAYSNAFNEALTGDIDFSEHYLENIKKLTPEDISRVAAKYLAKNSSTTVVLRQSLEPDSANRASVLEENTIEKHVLSNGLRLLIKQDSRLPLFSVKVFVNGGLRQEEPSLNGISNLAAQTWIKGAKAMNSEQIADLTEAKAIDLNAFSVGNSFGLTLDCLSEDITTAVNLLEGLIKDPSFTESELSKNKLNMKSALKERNDDIVRNGAFFLRQIIFKEHPYRNDINGTEESIDKITRKDVLNFYNSLAVPSNMVISVFGDLRGVDVKSLFDRKFGSLKKVNVELRGYAQQSLTDSIEKSIYMDKKQALFMAGFNGTTIRSEDRHAVDVLTTIIGSSFSGRLFQRVREGKGEAYSVGGWSSPGLDAGYIYFYALTSPESLAKVKDLILNEITDIVKNGVSDKEIMDSKEYLKGTFKASTETISELGNSVASDELYGLGHENYKDYDAKIDGVNADDISKAAIKYLNINQMAVVTVTPEPSAK